MVITHNVPMTNDVRDSVARTCSASATIGDDAGRPPRINSPTNWPMRVLTVTA